MEPVQGCEIEVLMEALIDRLYSLSWEAVQRRKLSRGPGPLQKCTSLISSYVAEEDMGHKALVAQCRECGASIVLRSDPKGDHSCLVPDPDVMVLEALWCPPPVAGQWDGEHVKGRSCPSGSAGDLCRKLLVEDAERVS